MIQLDTKIQLLTNEIGKHLLDLTFTLILQEMKGDRSRLHLQQTQHQNPNNEVPQERCATSRGYKIKLEEKASTGKSAQLLEEEIKLEVKPPRALMLNNSNTTRCSIRLLKRYLK
jgi:hypothetical protein